MTLQTSGIIRLGDIHVEAEGSIYAGTSISSLNDANIRALIPATGKTINATLSTTVSFSDFYGATRAIDTQTVTVGYLAPGQYNSESYGYDGYVWMYGSISDGTCNWLSGQAYRMVNWVNNVLNLTVQGTNVNAGFTSMVINGVTYTRASATYGWTGTNGGRQWTWGSITSNPLGASGASVKVDFL